MRLDEQDLNMMRERRKNVILQAQIGLQYICGFGGAESAKDLGNVLHGVMSEGKCF